MSGSTLADGAVADGLGGVVMIEVGVGTGGSSVRAGSGSPEPAMADGGAALGAVPGLVAPGRPGSDDSTATGTAMGFGGLGDPSRTEEVAGAATFAGAAPIPPSPPGALTGGGAGAGVPTVQPTVTANGRPRATTLKKIDLGEYRTSSSPDQAPEKLRRNRIRPELPAHRPLDRPHAVPVLSIGSHRMRTLFHGE